jgi:hypothetical protein
VTEHHHFFLDAWRHQRAIRRIVRESEGFCTMGYEGKGASGGFRSALEGARQRQFYLLILSCVGVPWPRLVEQTVKSSIQDSSVTCPHSGEVANCCTRALLLRPGAAAMTRGCTRCSAVVLATDNL